MCGIAGIVKFNSDRIQLGAIKSFTDSMAHRGPDGSGYELLNDGKVAFGHRRLSILDLTELGKQPMFYLERYCITYNGEVYNFIEIREELKKQGVNFKTDSDTEVILAAYHRWGKDAFSKFNGMWALAIWDALEKKLLVCRDRFGVKPLHYVHSPGNYFAFASETIAFGFLEGFKKELDDSTFLFSMNNPAALEPTGKTIYKNILQLLPGHYLELNQEKDITIKRWWNTFEHHMEVPKNEEERTQHFFELFKDACRIRLRSDVSVATALSGGLDSSSVFAMVNHLAATDKSYNRLPGNWRKAVVATFPGTDVDEKRYADHVIKYFGSEAIYTQPHYENLAKDIASTTKLFDALSGTPIVSITDVYKAMHLNQITVSLDGHGGDELLYGYKGAVNKLYHYYNKQQLFNSAQEMADIYAYMGDEKDSEATKQKLLDDIARLKGRHVLAKLKDTILMRDKRVSVMDAEAKINLHDWFTTASIENQVPFELFKGVQSEFLYPESLAVKDFFIDNIPYNLRDFDRAAMQHSVEIRMPLMDYRLVNYSFSLPLKDKLGMGYTKLILRKAMKNLLPEEIRLRKNKIGIGAPTTHWFNNQLNEFICDEVSSASFLQNKYWKAERIKDFVHQRCAERNWDNPSANRFWIVLNAHLLNRN